MPVARTAPYHDLSGYNQSTKYTKHPSENECGQLMADNVSLTQSFTEQTNNFSWTKDSSNVDAGISTCEPFGDGIREEFDADKHPKSVFPWISCLRASGAQSPATDLQTSKLTPVHSEAECSMHHQEIDYAHHKHYLLSHHAHHAHSSNHEFPESQSVKSQFIDPGPIIRLQDQRETQDSPSHLQPQDDNEESHFRNDYPHHHHHYHHHYHHYHHHHYPERKELTVPMDPVIDGLDLLCLANDKVPTVESPLDVMDPDTNSDLQQAWSALRLKVMHWLDGVQDSVSTEIVESG